MLQFTDAAPSPTGRLRIEVFRRDRLIEVFDEPNLVVNGMKQPLARLLGGDLAGRSVTQFGVGTSGAAVGVGNTTLTNPFLKAIDQASYPATNQVAFSFSIGSDEANGKAILEFGLFTAGGVLVARRVRASALNKENDISFNGTWTMTF